jgi:Flp pilus assembly protein TadD/peroxiredoxin
MKKLRECHTCNILLLQAAAVFTALVVGSFACTATAQALLQTGLQAPEFALNDIDGRQISLSQYAQDKTVVLVFWSTWSDNSSRALKRLEDYYKKYGDRRGVMVIGINADSQAISSDDVQRIKGTVKDLGITFPVLVDKELKTFHDYDVIALPSTAVIVKGAIAYELPGLPLTGTEEMFDYLAELAGEPASKKAVSVYQPRHDAIADTNLAKRFVDKKQYAMAYPLFQKAIEKDPKYMRPYVQLAKLYELDGKGTEAEETLKKALAVVPGNVVVTSELGYVQTRAGKVREALELLKNAAKDESYTPAHYYLAYALGMDGQLKEALAVFERAITQNPYDPIAYRLRAEVYEKQGMGKEAAAEYRKILELMLKIKN